jgi:hypothetical protein
MELVVVERALAAATPFAELAQQEAAANWCLATHQVRPLASYVATHGLAAVCLYEAPDAEAVRLAQKQAKLPVSEVWSALPIRFADSEVARPDWSTVVITRQMPHSVTPDFFRETTHAGETCLQRYRVLPLVTYLAKNGLRTICVSEAPDAESVRVANRQMKMPLVDLWSATFQRSPPHA